MLSTEIICPSLATNVVSKGLVGAVDEDEELFVDDDVVNGLLLDDEADELDVVLVESERMG